VLRADGTVLGWGLDIYGQATSPPGLSNVVAIACGSAHSVALKADGSVVAWGYGEVYEPNDSEYGQAIVPPALANVTAIAVGDYISLALQGDGPPVQQVNPTAFNWDGERFRLSVPTQVGRVYRLEYTDTLQDVHWTALPLTAGTGSVRTLTDTTADGRQRFYRVRRW
jgi:alpha-tubulin suppressor-like RCC1 family protein